MALPNRLKSARMTNATPGVAIDDHVGDLERALCDIFGFTIDSDITESPFLCDNSGRITKPLVRLAATGGTVGIRFRDVTNSKEFRLALANTQILIEENTGTEASPTWTSRLTIPLSTGLPRLASAANPSDNNDLVRYAYLVSYVTSAIQSALESYKKTIILPHTWAIGGEIKVPSGDIDYIVPFFVSAPSGQTVKLVKARHRINSGTSVTVKLQRNGSDITGWTGISITTTSTTYDGDDVTLSDGDMLALVVTAVSGTPKNMTFTAYLSYEV